MNKKIPNNEIETWKTNIANYFYHYETYTKTVVFYFTIGMGGIGDFFKFFIYLFRHCIKNKIKMKYSINDNALNKYITLISKEMYIDVDTIKKYKKIDLFKELENMESDIFYIVTPFCMYDIPDMYEKIPPCISPLFSFSEKVLQNAQNYLEKLGNYVAIHVRLGDAFLETDKQYVVCKSDSRQFDENQMFQFIEDTNNKTNIFFCCDNASYKTKIKAKYDNIITTDFDIGHTSLSNTTKQQYLDSVTEFYLLTQSDKIFAGTRSGFSIMASKFAGVPIIHLSL